MIHPKIPLAQTVIELCKAKNIQHIVISPGSRNAPLTIGFSHDDYFHCYSIVDERCAAFFALGIAQQIQKPVAVVCTSGSALLNYYPAVAEAFYSDIPLVVLSADRPKHLLGIGDGQTINQENVFENHILYSANLKQDLKEENSYLVNEDLPIFKNIENKLERLLGIQQNIQTQNEEGINEALNIAIRKKGPVHINIPFDEPLYERVEALTVKPKVIEVFSKTPKIDDVLLDEIVDAWYHAKKKLVIVGVNQPNTIEQKWLDELAEDESVVVFTESTSNIHHPKFFPSIDKIIAPLNEEQLQALQPEILLTFGGLIVSKKIKAFLRNNKPKHHWHIDTKKANDTFFNLEHHIKTTPNQFFSQFSPKITHVAKSDYQEFWLQVKKDRKQKHAAYLNSIAFSDLKVFQSVLKAIPNHSVLQLGNSSTIRYAQLFKVNKSVEVFCNRGTSGIDGSTSTAIGCAVGNPKQTTFITGDLSFFYDSNALWNNYIPNNFRIIIINNEGGGIFRILPGKKDTENFDTFFETKHSLSAIHLSEMYGFEYQKASNEEELSSALSSFYTEGVKPKILEIFTPRKTNDTVLMNYFKALK
ncbi:2-succinyl-5-enolpyruvyl-6-hydroxy-3-cyclohexene-1-carboxylate synthase [Oceanihabitans sediminis]|uniref:2-succinyl-5-enolpyruvyl-6-hydroxy-3-cyclohexene-1-carboxylate synthase n=1 Tax=Oceanihabitans sediminis TaxID=1812012 RepID=A0A368P598_9FLAO|nr:2-succinyl-5-enolpyruvyl-6-hydroxy-3-cyclohexene-1-carboxylate synthase [Oceanihabitans sediminis]MDX1277925.1 2-succinyl-5-enolpyruvyl-6-hydroxy-3-cyclohexene-1-carboxylate synthase [Oceanihabitans sediminis]MDX1773391.1 2-succinyl-5-enolpyruvyl-6-hydroxy-3-cyclohexene-1-carboxylate synthase [Oceanihabitans sediminis]RBP32847.1 2-succinyl-5-enolpyruvyl-6-hydroxy-3-cyclohexene-1-carboxylate synthase [Oceanihabitans sediminis]RCU57623.1 2-succinyl-5-enolpyruvyl-6-hydroxy-3-cyclohexene-1-carbo